MHFNIADLFESLVDAIPDRLAVVSGKHRLTFAELEARANRLAHSLTARGVKAGDHVGLYLFNGHEFIEAMLATFKIRAVPININYRYVADELSFLFSNADLVALLHQREFSPQVDAVAPQVPTLKTRIYLDDTSGAPVGEALEYETLLAKAPPVRDFSERSGDDLYVIYTGGTTGMPRGVMWRQEDVFFAGLQGGNPGGPHLEKPEELAQNAIERTEPMIFLPAPPFIHGAAQWTALIGMFGGGKVVLQPGRSFDAKVICELIGRERVTTITLVGDAMARPFVEALRAGSSGSEPYDTSSLMVVVSAGAVLSDSVKQELIELLPHAMVLNSFGATETGHQGTAFPGEGGKAGQPTFFMDDSNTVLGEDGKPIVPGSGVVGRLARRGRLPIGYYKDPVKTAATFVTLDGQRWVVPGDLATIGEDGAITVFGRGAMCINSGGEKVFPEEVEVALKSHPSIVDALVVGVPDERWGQRVAAVVQTRPGTEITLAEVDAHCRARVAGYKVPRQLKIVSEVQRQPSGKPDYRWAREMALLA
jgi:acyl-CoA synthetase (AMP-forming)/AMP-acid ligase II